MKSPKEAMLWLWEEAPRHNCSISHSLAANNQVNLSKLKINGQICRVRLFKMAKKYKNKDAAYAVATLRGNAIRKTDFQIFVIWVPGKMQRLFILPSEIFLEKYRFSDNRNTFIYIPVDKLPSQTGGYIDWWQYENAWHLLGGEQRIQRPKVARLAKKRKFTIPDGVNICDHVPIDQRTSLLNGKKCAIRLLSSTFRSNKSVHADYMRANLKRSVLMNTDFQLFVLQSEHEDKYFIVPSNVLIKSYKLETDAPRGIYIPLIKTMAYRNHKAALDWWQYENAWHLLEQRS